MSESEQRELTGLEMARITFEKLQVVSHIAGSDGWNREDASLKWLSRAVLKLATEAEATRKAQDARDELMVEYGRKLSGLDSLTEDLGRWIETICERMDVQAKNIAKLKEREKEGDENISVRFDAAFRRIEKLEGQVGELSSAIEALGEISECALEEPEEPEGGFNSDDAEWLWKPLRPAGGDTVTVVELADEVAGDSVAPSPKFAIGPGERLRCSADISPEWKAYFPRWKGPSMIRRAVSFYLGDELITGTVQRETDIGDLCVVDDLGVKRTVHKSFVIIVGGDETEVAASTPVSPERAEDLEAADASKDITRALQEADSSDLWCRPRSWAGTGYAYCVEDGRILKVPDLRGGGPAQFPTLGSILEPWEVVSPDVVNTEWEI